MPLSLREWLAEDHLAWFVLDSVAELDLEAGGADGVLGVARGVAAAADERPEAALLGGPLCAGEGGMTR